MALYLGAPPWRDGEGGRRCLVREGCAPLTLRSARGVAPGCSRVLADASSPPPAVPRGGGREAWLRRRRVGGRTMRAALHRPPAPSARRLRGATYVAGCTREDASWELGAHFPQAPRRERLSSRRRVLRFGSTANALPPLGRCKVVARHVLCRWPITYENVAVNGIARSPTQTSKQKE